MPNIFQRMGSAVRSTLPRIKPATEMGTSGVSVTGGYVQVKEKSPAWVGRQKYVTIGELATNTSIVAAGVHYFLNLIANPTWKVEPVSDDAKAKEAAEFAEEVIYDMRTSWARIVRRTGNYRFYGFGVQEWIAKKRPDGRNGLFDIEPRPQHTIEKWEVEDDGTIAGMWQRSPQTNQLLGLPRGKVIYLVDDTLTDNPEGMGAFRHMANSYNRLKAYEALEMRAFERDLRGTPIGRAPITALNQLVKDKVIKQTEATALINDLKDFVKMQVRQSDTGLVLDSMTYESQGVSGLSPSGTPQWGLDLLTGSGAGLAEMNTAIDRIQREMARLIGTEHMLLGGEGSANRALSEDKSQNLYLIANAVLTYMSEGMRNDILGPIWMLNGLDEELMPWFTTEDVAFKDAQEIATTLRDMATAGAVLRPDDPIIDDVRDLMGVSRQPEVDPELINPEPLADVPEEDIDEDMDEDEEAGLGKGVIPFYHRLGGFGKFDPTQPRDDRGQWTIGGATLSSAPKDRSEWPPHIANLRVPPAWRDVHINEDPDGDLLVVGKDVKGRPQYVYSKKYAASQARAKFARIRELTNKYEAIKAENLLNESSDDPRLAEHAEVTSVIMATGIRPGSDADTRAEKKAYGATTLEGRHVVRSGGQTSLRFVGKKGVEVNIPVTDRHAATILRTRAREAGGDGRLFPNVTQGSTLSYVHELDGGGFKTKDFRTALGTTAALRVMAKMPKPKTLRTYRQAVMSVAKSVSSRLGNTPTVALQSYIDPTAFSGWRHAARA